MSKVITKNRFLVIGQEAPKGSRFKGIVTQQSIVGWSMYTGRISAKIQGDIGDDLVCKKDGFLGYTSSRPGATGTYSYLGWVDVDKKKTLTKDLMKATNHNGAILYDSVLSLPNYEYSKKMNLNNLTDYAKLVQKILPEFLKSISLDPKNIIWWEDYHTNTNHPHLHICFIEKEQTRTRGKLTQKQLDTFQLFFAKELGLRQFDNGKSNVDYMKQKDQALADLILRLKSNQINFSNNNSLLQLKMKLPLSGRMQYGSSAMIPFRNELDNITRSLLNRPELKMQFEHYLDSLNILNKQMVKVTGKKSNLYDNELNKLFRQFGNIVLQELKTLGNLKNENIENSESSSSLQNNTESNEVNEFLESDSIHTEDKEELDQIEAGVETNDLLRRKEVVSVNEDNQYNYKMILDDFEKLSKDKKSNSSIEYTLGKLYESGLGSEPDLKKGYEHFMKASEMGSIEANIKLAKLFMKENNISQAKKYALRAYEKGDKKSCYLLSKIFLSEENIDTAIFMLNESAKDKNPMALFKLGMFYLKGKFVQKNTTLGIEYLQSSSLLGNPYAMERLKQINKKRDAFMPKAVKKFAKHLKFKTTEIEKEIEKYLYSNYEKAEE